MKSSPHSQQLEKALMQQGRSNAAKKKETIFKRAEPFCT